MASLQNLKRSWTGSPALAPPQEPSSQKRRRKRKSNSSISVEGKETLVKQEPQSFMMDFGSWEMPHLQHYYQTHLNLGTYPIEPLFSYPIEILANCRKFQFEKGTIMGSGMALVPIGPPIRLPELSKHEFYALWAEDTLRGVEAFASKWGEKHKKVRRFRRNFRVLSFMRACWDAVLTPYQIIRSQQLVKFGVFLSNPNSRAIQGINRFRIQLVHHPVEAAKRAKKAMTANRAWYFGGPRPEGRLLRFDRKIDALTSSFGARALPPAPPGPEGLEGLVERLTSTPANEPPDWREFVKEYISRWKPKAPPELYTMPSSNAALGYPRAAGGHVTGVQHLVLIGYALCRCNLVSDENRYDVLDDPMGHVQDGSYLELLSDALHPSSSLKPAKLDYDSLFRKPWSELEKDLPGVSHRLQYYLKIGTMYVLDNIEYLPILPIAAEEKGLKTRFPTCSLTAANLVQQILRRVIDHVMINDPRFSQALGGKLDVNLAGEVGPWYSQDASSATDLHAQWLTQPVYEELAEVYPSLRPYRKYFEKIFGVKKLLLNVQSNDFLPVDMIAHYPRAPILDDAPITVHGRTTGDWARDLEHGHGSLILDIANSWISDLNDAPGTLTTTGQMMGDPTSFPPLMLHTLYAASKVLEILPYTEKESRKRHKGLRKGDVVLKGVGDDAQKPRWTAARRALYDKFFVSMGGRLSYEKCFHHSSRSIIAEIVYEHGRPVPMLSLSTLVAPPGGSKGHVTWNTQAAALAGDPERPRVAVSKSFWRASPYYYTWMLADRLGIPISVSEGYGGVGVPLVPKRSLTDNVNWLRYLSQCKVEDLIAGVGLTIGEPSNQTFLDRSSRQWLKDVLATSLKSKEKHNFIILTNNPLSEEAIVRKSLTDAYKSALGRIRATEFYFRAPFVGTRHNPSVRVAVRKFQQKVRKVKPTPVKGWQKTSTDLDEKKSLYFSTGAGFLPDPWNPPELSSFGLERSGEVRTRYIAPHLMGLG
nr:RNA-dependent RNA polymerase [Zymoseptoria tritici narnavirus 1]